MKKKEENSNNNEKSDEKSKENDWRNNFKGFKNPREKLFLALCFAGGFILKAYLNYVDKGEYISYNVNST